MSAEVVRAFQCALSKVGYSFDAEESLSLGNVYCETKQLRPRRTRGTGLEHQSLLAEVSKYIPRGLRATGEGAIEIADGLTVEHLAREDFEHFRQFLGLSEDAYNRSFFDVTGGVTSDGGRSGSLYWFSRDRRYILKSVSRSDLNNLLRMMPRYVEHFSVAARAGRPCFLLRFLGAYLFRAGNETLGLICMNDVWDGQKPSRIYDLKGTTQNRFVDVEDDTVAGVVLKDLNLRTYFLIDGINGKAFWDAFGEDADFLENENSIDYSLLLGVDEVNPSLSPQIPQVIAPGFQSPACYTGYELPDDRHEVGRCNELFPRPEREINEQEDEPEDVATESAKRKIRLGIIDFLGQWNLRKKTEGLFKSLIGCYEEHSSMPPDYYRERWLRYLEDKIVVEDE